MVHKMNVAQAADDVERSVLNYLEDLNGAHVSMLQVFNYLTMGATKDAPVTLNFFNTLLGSMRAVGAIEIDKKNKTIAITEAGLSLLRARDQWAKEIKEIASVKAGA
jgi:hypothetical protein